MTTPGGRRLSPPSTEWRHVAWAGGAFDTARRPYAAHVAGEICLPEHLVLVTLRGGARRVEVAVDGAPRYVGADRPGAVSFLPAGRRRRIVMADAETEWASLSLPAAAVDGAAGFTNADEPMIAAVLAELATVHALDGALDPLMLDAAALLVAARLQRPRGVPGEAALPAWRLRRVRAHIEAHLFEPLPLTALAAAAGLSPSRFHRAFRAATGETPLACVTRLRLEAAAARLAAGGDVTGVALATGFGSPSQFARHFRRRFGTAPAAWRRTR